MDTFNCSSSSLSQRNEKENKNQYNTKYAKRKQEARVIYLLAAFKNSMYSCARELCHWFNQFDQNQQGNDIHVMTLDIKSSTYLQVRTPRAKFIKWGAFPLEFVFYI